MLGIILCACLLEKKRKKTLTKICNVVVKGQDVSFEPPGPQQCSTYQRNPLEDRKSDGTLKQALYAGICFKSRMCLWPIYNFLAILLISLLLHMSVVLETEFCILGDFCSIFIQTNSVPFLRQETKNLRASKLPGTQIGSRQGIVPCLPLAIFITLTL